MKTELGLLGLTKRASWDEIKRAYRDKMKKCHPDLNADNTMMLNDANQESKEVNAAYDKLKSCLSQTGKFVSPVFTFIKKPKKAEPEMAQTNIGDFFRPREAAEVSATSGGASFLFNAVLVLLWLGVLAFGTIEALSYFYSI